MDRGAWRAAVHGVAKESDVTWHLNNSSQCKPPVLVGNFGAASGEVGSLIQSLWVVSCRYQLCTTIASDKWLRATEIRTLLWCGSQCRWTHREKGISVDWANSLVPFVPWEGRRGRHRWGRSWMNLWLTWHDPQLSSGIVVAAVTGFRTMEDLGERDHNLCKRSRELNHYWIQSPELCFAHNSLKLPWWAKEGVFLFHCMK